MKKNIDNELLSSKSPVSSMRWAFIATIRTILWLTGISIAGAIVLPFFGKSLDLMGVSVLLSPITAFAFGGKSYQKKYEEAPESDSQKPATTPETKQNPTPQE